MRGSRYFYRHDCPYAISPAFTCGCCSRILVSPINFDTCNRTMTTTLRGISLSPWTWRSRGSSSTLTHTIAQFGAISIRLPKMMHDIDRNTSLGSRRGAVSTSELELEVCCTSHWSWGWDEHAAGACGFHHC